MTAERWTHPYSRQVAAFPVGREGPKYWPPVRRVDNAYGDRNLVCTCAAPAEYERAAALEAAGE